MNCRLIVAVLLLGSLMLTATGCISGGRPFGAEKTPEHFSCGEPFS